MRKSLVLFTPGVLVALLVSAALAQAEPRSHRRGRVVVVDAPRVIVTNPGDWHFHRPPGWDRGRKVGWGNCDLPPGLAQKYGCYSSFWGRRGYFDRRFDRRFRRDAGLVIHVPGRFFLELR